MSPSSDSLKCSRKAPEMDLLQQLVLLTPAHKAHDMAIIPQIPQVIMYQAQIFVQPCPEW